MIVTVNEVFIKMNIQSYVTDVFQYSTQGKRVFISPQMHDVLSNPRMIQVIKPMYF